MNAVDAVAVPAMPAQDLGFQSSPPVSSAAGAQAASAAIGLGQGSGAPAPKVIGDSVEISKTARNLGAAAKPTPVDPFPEVKIPAVEKLIEKIKNNGFPYESNFYKAIHRIVASDTN